MNPKLLAGMSLIVFTSLLLAGCNNITPQLPDDTSTVVVYVWNGTTGYPYNDGTVTIVGVGVKKANENDQGKATFYNVPNGLITIMVDPVVGTYTPITETKNLNGDTSFTINIYEID